MENEPPAREASDDDLLKVCQLLNDAGARYLVCGGFAMILHAVPRATKDVDLLIMDAPENHRRVLMALSRLADGAAAELTPQDLVDNLVVKILDEVEVDVSRRAWVVTYDDAIANAKELIIDGVCIPYLGLQDLIRSKQTYRDKDRADIQMLMARTPELQETAKSAGGEKRGCLAFFFRPRKSE